MPAILSPEDERRWLDADLAHIDAEQLLRPLASDQMEAYPVAPLVNSWENEGPELIEPFELGAQDIQMGLPFD